jgi:alkylhydroperoxidase family enzyme
MNVERKQRIPFQDFSVLSNEDRQMAERTQINGKVVNIFRVLMQHPKLVRAWGRFANYILSDQQTLAPREREILILRIGWLNQAPYEFEQHVRIGKGCGLTDDEIDRICKGPSAGWSKHDAALIEAADDLFQRSGVRRNLEHFSRALQDSGADGRGIYGRPVQYGFLGIE